MLKFISYVYTLLTVRINYVYSSKTTPTLVTILNHVFNFVLYLFIVPVQAMIDQKLGTFLEAWSLPGLYGAVEKEGNHLLLVGGELDPLLLLLGLWWL